MKKQVIIAFACMIAIVAASHTAAIFSWTEMTHSFGSIKRGVPVSYEFEFINRGTEPLIITNVQAACGCTVVNYSKDPVSPGSKGFVKATYNAANLGAFSKIVTVQSNASESPTLTLKGTVIE